ncbi:MAG: Tex family protein [Candidatus Sericytochromatia bacterium]
MDFTEDFIEKLELNKNLIIEKITKALDIKKDSVVATIELLDEGNTIPFISRYRKEKIGYLNEIQVKDIEQKLLSLTNLETRKIEVIKAIFSQNLLNKDIYDNINKCETITSIEELYLPYKKKKKTRAMIAIEKGLEKLANMLYLLNDAELKKRATDFINLEKEVKTEEEALNGAMDIIAEKLAQDVDNRAEVKNLVWNYGKYISEGLKDEKVSTYKIYYNYQEIIKNIKPHQILALNRGEKEEELKIKIDYNFDDLIQKIEKRYVIKNNCFKLAIKDSLDRLLLPSVLREIKTELVEKAEKHSISIFSENLKNLLMQQPIKRTRILSIDPGIRTGSKCAVIDENGKYLDSFVINQFNKEKSEYEIINFIKKYNLELITIGNGTGSQEIQELVTDIIKEKKANVSYTVVPEDGASVYSASEIAIEEFPSLDLTIRGAISIGRRIQDPLAELVKIDPKSIGVGLYQHDINQKDLSESLDYTVLSVVNQVGVNVNTASAALLKNISGINSTVAKNIVKYREENGIFKTRNELKKVKGLGAKAFEQASGFLMIPESSNPLDNTWVHPENYKVGEKILNLIQKKLELDYKQKTDLKTTFEVTDSTINDILENLNKKRIDPREDFPKPILQKGVVNFDDLKKGMMVEGKVKNVVDFGAFIDIGIKETALLHISEMGNKFVKNPMEVVKVGDTLKLRILDIDIVRKRISLSLKN